MREWWDNLSQREQWLLRIGGVAVFVTLFYLFIWSSITASITSKESYVNYQQNLVTWMQESNVKLKQLRASGQEVQTVDRSDLLTTVVQTLKANRLNGYANSIEQTDVNKVLVKFKKVPFDSLFTWISQLWKVHEVKVEQINIIPDIKVRGLVSSEVVFTV